MKFKFLIVLMATILPGLAAAQDAVKYQCSYADLQRRVEIFSEPGVDVPCEVHYYKDTESPDEDQVLWSAQSEAGYCARKASEFVAKLEGWGWDCGQGAAAAEGEAAEASDAAEAAEAEEPADDTEVLAPAAESE